MTMLPTGTRWDNTSRSDTFGPYYCPNTIDIARLFSRLIYLHYLRCAYFANFKLLSLLSYERFSFIYTYIYYSAPISEILIRLELRASVTIDYLGDAHTRDQLFCARNIIETHPARNLAIVNADGIIISSWLRERASARVQPHNARKRAPDVERAVKLAILLPGHIFHSARI